jgi:hypothetical protein
MEEGGNEVKLRVIEEQGIFQARERPRDRLRGRHVIPTDLQYVGVIERKDRKTGAVGGVRQEELAVADGDIRLPMVDQVEDLAVDARDAGDAMREMAARARHGNALVLVHRVGHGHFQHGIQAAEHFRDASAADEMKFMLREPADDGEGARHVPERVAHYSVQDSRHDLAKILLIRT